MSLHYLKVLIEAFNLVTHSRFPFSCGVLVDYMMEGFRFLKNACQLSRTDNIHTKFSAAFYEKNKSYRLTHSFSASRKPK